MILPIIKGDDKLYQLEFTKDGVPQDITGWKIYFTLKRDFNGTDIGEALMKDITEHTDPTNGISQLFLTHEETALLSGHYVFDIQVKTAVGMVTTVMIGTIDVKPDITVRTD